MKIFYKTFQPLVATDKDKHVTFKTDSATLEDLIKAILSKEERSEQETAFLYLPSGIPLNFTPVSVTFSLKRWYIKDGDHLLVMFTDKDNTADGDPGVKILSHKFHADAGNACIIVNVKGDRQCALKVSENENMQHIYERVSHFTGVPCKYIQLYHSTGLIDPGSNSSINTLSQGESIDLKMKFRPQRRFYDAFNAKNTKILCEQTDAGLRMFYSLLFILAHYLTDEGHDLEVLSYILQLTACPPLVLSLAMIFDKRMPTVAQAVAMQEGLFELFRRLTHNRRTRANSETDENVDHTFEYSEQCWRVLLSNCRNLDPTQKLPSTFHHIIRLQCHECDQHLSFCMPSRTSSDDHTLCDICGSSNLEVDQLTSQLAIALPLEEEASYWCMENWYSREPIDIPLKVVDKPPPNFMHICSVYDLKNSPAEFPPPRLFKNAEDQIIIFTGRTGTPGALKTHYLFDPLNGKEDLEDIGKIDFCQHVKKLKGGMHDTVFIEHAPDEAVVILLDISSSMKRKAKTVLWHGQENAVATTKLHIAQKFFVAFAKRTIAFGLEHAHALTFFNNIIQKKCIFSESVEALVHVLEEELESIKASGDTHLWDAIVDAGEQLCDLPEICNKSTKRILCLTDGSDSGSDHNLLDCAKLLCENKIVLDMILIGRENSEARSLAYITGGFPFYFREVSEALCIAEAEPLLSVRSRQKDRRSESRKLTKGALNDFKKWPYAQLVVKNPPPSQVKMSLSQAIVEVCEKTPIPDSFHYLMIRNPISLEDVKVITPINAINLSKSLNKDFQNSRIKRILKELTLIAKDGIPGPNSGNIDVYTLKECVDNWVGTMPCPMTSPYASMLIFTVVFPHDYPKSPPLFRFETPILHPNVSSDGRVCHRLLQKRLYSQELSMTVLIKQVSVLLAHPIWEDGADTVRADAYKRNSKAFEVEARKRSESIPHNELYTKPESDSDCDIPEEDEAWFLQNC